MNIQAVMLKQTDPVGLGQGAVVKSKLRPTAAAHKVEAGL
jgi:hypothetical protein